MNLPKTLGSCFTAGLLGISSIGCIEKPPELPIVDVNQVGTELVPFRGPLTYPIPERQIFSADNGVSFRFACIGDRITVITSEEIVVRACSEVVERCQKIMEADPAVETYVDCRYQSVKNHLPPDPTCEDLRKTHRAIGHLDVCLINVQHCLDRTKRDTLGVITKGPLCEDHSQK